LLETEAAAAELEDNLITEDKTSANRMEAYYDGEK